MQPRPTSSLRSRAASTSGSGLSKLISTTKRRARDMKAIGYRTAGPVSAQDSLIDLELPAPAPGPRDLRVAVKAVSVNPADVQMSARISPPNGGVASPAFAPP